MHGFSGHAHRLSATLRPVYANARTAVIGGLERRAGIRTFGFYTPEELGYSSEHRVRYMPARWLALWRLIPRNDVTQEDVFVDFGCGMGRVLYQAAVRYPFRRVNGVEMSERLAVVARDNIERTRHKLLCQDVRVVVSDALDYELPDDATIAFFFNPFTGPIFTSVLERLMASLERNPRRVRIVYQNPIEQQMLLDAGFRPVKRLRGMRPGAEWSRSNSVVLYELPA
jgi:precorrin-6B methylase 2